MATPPYTTCKVVGESCSQCLRTLVARLINMPRCGSLNSFSPLLTHNIKYLYSIYMVICANHYQIAPTTHTIYSQVSR